LNTSQGPDGIPPIVYKSLKFQLASPLAMLFELILQFGALPDQWKVAIVRPIVNKGNSSDPNNYRPISLLVCAVKCLNQL